MIVILKDYGQTCSCVWKSPTNPDDREYFMITRAFATTMANYFGCELVDVSAEVEEQKLLEHNKVLIIKK